MVITFQNRFGAKIAHALYPPSHTPFGHALANVCRSSNRAFSLSRAQGRHAVC